MRKARPARPSEFSPPYPGFSPTGNSWLIVLKRRGRDQTQQRIRRGVFHRVEQLEAALVEQMVTVKEAIQKAISSTTG